MKQPITFNIISLISKKTSIKCNEKIILNCINSINAENSTEIPILTLLLLSIINAMSIPRGNVNNKFPII